MFIDCGAHCAYNWCPVLTASEALACNVCFALNWLIVGVVVVGVVGAWHYFNSKKEASHDD